MPRSFFRILFPALAFLLLDAFLLTKARGEGIRLFSDIGFTHSTSERTDKQTGDRTKSVFSEIDQIYNLDLSRRVFPNLLLRVGGNFEFDSIEAESDNTKMDTKERTIQPFIDLNLKNPFYQTGIGYRKFEIKEDISGVPSTKRTRDVYNALLRWMPVDFPFFDINYNRINSYDEPETVDRMQDLVTLKTRYAWKNMIETSYTYTYNNQQEDIADFGILQRTHNGRVNISRRLMNNRLAVNAGYGINYSSSEFSGAGSERIPVPRVAGLVSLDGTPADGPPLNPNTVLIDGNTGSSAGVDIGLGGDGTVFTNIGLDFGVPETIDTIFLWVDRILPSTIADSFSWEIYTSPDNSDQSIWTLHATSFPAPFGEFDNRFEITFPAVETRFIKVVTRPLSPTVAGASSFPNIFVTEMEAFTVRSAQESPEFIRNDQTYDLTLQWRMSDKTNMVYGLYYRNTESDPPFQRRTSLSNSVDIAHAFNRTFSGFARVSRSDEKGRSEDSVNYSYSASLRASHLDTFSQSLTYSGTKSTEDRGTSMTNSILLHNNAVLYEGWSAILDLGYSSLDDVDDRKSTSYLARVGTNLVPNNKITININYTATSTKDRGPEGDFSIFNQTMDFDAFLLPLRTLSLSARINFSDIGGSSNWIQNYAVNWLPFPDGDLTLSVNYNELLRSDDDRKERTIGPSIRWDVSRHVLLSMSYNFIDADSRFEEISSQVFDSSLKLLF